MLFAVATLFILAVLLHYSTVISKLADQNVILAQRLALLEQRTLPTASPGLGNAGRPGERAEPGRQRRHEQRQRRRQQDEGGERREQEPEELASSNVVALVSRKAT